MICRCFLRTRLHQREGSAFKIMVPCSQKTLESPSGDSLGHVCSGNTRGEAMRKPGGTDLKELSVLSGGGIRASLRSCIVRCPEMKRQGFGFPTKQLPPRLAVGSCGRSVTCIDGCAVCPSLGQVCPIWTKVFLLYWIFTIVAVPCANNSFAPGK